MHRPIKCFYKITCTMLCFALFHYFRIFEAIQKLTADAWLPNNSDPVVRKTWTSFAECWGGQVQVETNLESFICSSFSLLLEVHWLNNLQFLQDQIWNHIVHNWKDIFASEVMQYNNHTVGQKGETENKRWIACFKLSQWTGYLAWMLYWYISATA